MFGLIKSHLTYNALKINTVGPLDTLEQKLIGEKQRVLETSQTPRWPVSLEEHQERTVQISLY